MHPALSYLVSVVIGEVVVFEVVVADVWKVENEVENKRKLIKWHTSRDE